MKTNANDSSQTPDDASKDEMSEAEIDENLEDTFPASDPPAWTLGSDHRPNAEQEPEDDPAKQG